MFSLFTLPDDFIASSTAYIGSYIDDLSPVLVLIVGTSLFMWVAGWVIGKISARGRAR